MTKNRVKLFIISIIFFSCASTNSHKTLINANLTNFENIAYILDITGGFSPFISQIPLLDGYSSNFSSKCWLESLISNDSGYFGSIVFQKEFAKTNASIHRTKVQNLTNMVLWPFKSIESWETYTIQYHNLNTDNKYSVLKYDRFNSVLWEVRSYTNNITECLFVDTKKGVTTRIEWHNSSIIPHDFIIGDDLYLSGTVHMDIIEEQSDQTTSGAPPPLPIISIIFLAAIPCIYYFSRIKDFFNWGRK